MSEDPNRQEFNEFIDGFLTMESAAEEIPADSPIEELPIEDSEPELEEIEKEEEEKVEETEEVEAPAPAPKEEPKPKESAPSEVEALRSQLAVVSQQLQEALVANNQVSRPEEPLGVEEFIQEEAFDEALSSAEGMNKLLQGVYVKAVATAREMILKQVPEVVTPMVEDQVNRRQIVNDFYKDNKDLVSMKDYVGFVAKEVASNEPDLTLPQLLDKVAVEVRSRLGTRTPKPKQRRSGAVAPRTVRQPSPKQLQGMDAHIAELCGF